MMNERKGMMIQLSYPYYLLLIVTLYF